MQEYESGKSLSRFIFAPFCTVSWAICGQTPTYPNLANCTELSQTLPCQSTVPPTASCRFQFFILSAEKYTQAETPFFPCVNQNLFFQVLWCQNKFESINKKLQQNVFHNDHVTTIAGKEFQQSSQWRTF